MKNNFTLEVSFKNAPIYSYEWDNKTFITGLKVYRIKPTTLKDLLTHDAIISTNSRTLLLSDCKTTIVLRLDRSGKITKRSFASFKEDIEICEYASNLKCTNIKYKLFETKIKYTCNLNEEANMREYVINSLKKIEDDNEYKYLYYLFFDQINDYSKEKLINSIIKNKPGNFQKLYDFLVTK